MGLKVIVTGATGMVGEGVMYECLHHPQVDEVLVLSRRPTGMQHPKLKEVLHADFFDINPVKHLLAGYDACYFCLGVSSVGVGKEEYYRLTYTLTMHVATTLAPQNPGMVFCYISGRSTDSSEQGRMAWARVKGKTENDLMKLPFRQVYAFRPGFIKPIKGLKRINKFYKYINWMFPIGRRLFPGGFCTLKELATAMIYVTLKGYDKSILEGEDIISAAKG